MTRKRVLYSPLGAITAIANPRKKSDWCNGFRNNHITETKKIMRSRHDGFLLGQD